MSVSCFDCGNICILLKKPTHVKTKYILKMFFHSLCLKKKKKPNVSFWIYKTLHLFKNIVRNFHLREGKKTQTNPFHSNPQLNALPVFQFGQ